jgi:hypothetical protein
MLARVQWATTNQQQKTIDPAACAKILAGDSWWLDLSCRFLWLVEFGISNLKKTHLDQFKEFARFCLLNKMLWPHVLAMKKQIEAAGFVYFPHSIQRDRMVCKTCGAEVSGWRAWHNPWVFHDLSKHPPKFRTLANTRLKQTTLPATVSTTTTTLPTVLSTTLSTAYHPEVPSSVFVCPIQVPVVKRGPHNIHIYTC